MAGIITRIDSVYGRYMVRHSRSSRVSKPHVIQDTDVDPSMCVNCVQVQSRQGSRYTTCVHHSELFGQYRRGCTCI